MKILPEYFDPSQFITPQYDSHFTIKRPYTNFAKSMRLNFQEYYVIIRLENTYKTYKTYNFKTTKLNFLINFFYVLF